MIFHIIILRGGLNTSLMGWVRSNCRENTVDHHKIWSLQKTVEDLVGLRLHCFPYHRIKIALKKKKGVTQPSADDETSRHTSLSRL